MIKLLLILLYLTPFATEANAAYFKDIKQIEMETNIAMNIIKSGDISKAFNGLRSFWPISDNEFEIGKRQASQSVEGFQKRFGLPIDVVHINSSNVANTFIKINYLVKYTQHAIQWEFYFYNGPKGWILNTVDTHDNIQKLFNLK